MSNDSKPAASWRFLNPASAYKADRGDTLRYFPDRPAGQRFTIERALQMHEGMCDRLILTDVLTPLGSDSAKARETLIRQLTADAYSRIAA